MSSIHINIFGLNITFSFKSNVSEELKKSREELDDHLQAINENTNEIQGNYEYLCELDSKIEKYTQKLENMQIQMERMAQDNMSVMNSGGVSLTRMEQELFLTLYTAESMTMSEIAINMKMSDTLVRKAVANLIRKGIPIVRDLKGSIPVVNIASEFKDLQAKETIVDIDPIVAQKFL